MFVRDKTSRDFITQTCPLLAKRENSKYNQESRFEEVVFDIFVALLYTNTAS